MAKELNKDTFWRWIRREYPELNIQEDGILDKTLIVGFEDKTGFILKEGILYTNSYPTFIRIDDTENITQAITEFFWSNVIKPKEFKRSRQSFSEFLADPKLDLEIEPFDALPCSCRVFMVNGIRADIDDFGDNQDFDPNSAPPYCCGDHHFEAYSEPQEGILEKYSITLDEYKVICDELTDKLAVGTCGWCE